MLEGRNSRRHTQAVSEVSIIQESSVLPKRREFASMLEPFRKRFRRKALTRLNKRLYHTCLFEVHRQ